MRANGYKTKTSELILSCLRKNKDIAISVQDIAKYLEQCGENPNITTIYRQLEKLLASKKIITHSSEDAKKSLYQYVEGANECFSHLHIQCVECAKIFHLDCEDSLEFTNHIEKEHGVILDFTKTVLYGVCSDCRKKR